MSYEYDIDLRKSVLAYVSQGHSYTEASKIFGISRQTIYNWLSLQKAYGSLKMLRTGKRRAEKFNSSLLREYVDTHPDA